MDVIGEARRIIPKCSPVSDGVFLKYIFGPRGSAAKWLFFLLTTRLSICLPPDTGRSLSGRRGRSPNADNCSLHNSSGPHPGHSIIIQLFLDKPTQINIYSCSQVRGLYEQQGGSRQREYSKWGGEIKKGKKGLWMILKIWCVTQCVDVGLLVVNLKYIFTQSLEWPQQTLRWLTDEHKEEKLKI